MTTSNHQFRLAARPVGLPKNSDWKYTEEPVREPADGELLEKVMFISLDPAMRGWINEGKSYIAPVEIGHDASGLAELLRRRVSAPAVDRAARRGDLRRHTREKRAELFLTNLRSILNPAAS